VDIYFSPSTTFGTPASWLHIGTHIETGIAPGSMRVTGPLVFPNAMIPAVGHYCMIAVVSDAFDPAPKYNLIASVGDFLEYVRNSNNLAYRNMDVVDLIPGTPGVLSVEVKSLPRTRERFDLRIGLSQFVPGAKIHVRGRAGVLDAAIARGLKLVARIKDENIYEALAGRDLARHQAFTAAREPLPEFAHGFDNVLVEKSFPLKVEYTLPKTLEELGPHALCARYILVVRQLWKGETVGAAGLLIRAHGERHRRPQNPPRQVKNGRPRK
jgi:hypothetical protein